MPGRNTDPRRLILNQDVDPFAFEELIDLRLLGPLPLPLVQHRFPRRHFEVLVVLLLPHLQLQVALPFLILALLDYPTATALLLLLLMRLLLAAHQMLQLYLIFLSGFGLLSFSYNFCTLIHSRFISFLNIKLNILSEATSPQYGCLRFTGLFSINVCV